MKRLLLSTLVAVASSSPLGAQRIEDVGAGVISFLLRNPRTADRMKPDERIALDIIEDLLRTEGQRKHELEYAASASNRITILMTDGREVQFVRNTAGDVFLLLHGVIHPISPELLNEASSTTIPDTPEDALTAFLDALRAGSFPRMGEVWGSATRGPAVRFMDRREMEMRLTLIRCVLLHERYQILPVDTLSRPRLYHVRLMRSGSSAVVPFNLVTFGQGWLIESIDAAAAERWAAECMRRD